MPIHLKTAFASAKALAIGLLLLATTATPAHGAFISLTGSLDPNDPNDVLFIAFSLAGGANVFMQSYGFGGTAQASGGANAEGTVIAPGGFDTYFSLFSGVGPAATFLTSNDDGTCPPGDDALACRDSTLNLNLAAGSYTLAVSVFDNFSFAENLGTGTLGDGFIGLGSYFNLDSFSDTTSDFAVDIVADGATLIEFHRLSDETPTVPEPNVPELLLIAMGALVVSRYRRLRPS